MAQVLSFYKLNPTHCGDLLALAVGGAAITAFYMFRLWFMTFAGKPRDHHVYDHAHESPRVDVRAAGGAGRFSPYRGGFALVPVQRCKAAGAGAMSGVRFRPGF